MSDGETGAGWVVSWAASVGGASGEFAGPQATVRQIMRLSGGGDALRLRFANPHSYAPLTFDAVTIGIPAAEEPAGLSLVPKEVMFGGKRRVVVQPGQVVTSDSVALRVADLSEVVVSIFAEQPVEVSSHAWANRFTWSTLSAVGDRSADTSGSGYRPWAMCWAWVDAIDVLQSRPAGSVVAIGDSITDGAGSDFGTDTRWTDRLAERLLALPIGHPGRRNVVNAGIGGNTLAGYGNSAVGVNVLSRLERDAVSLSGVTEVIVTGGSNDLYLGGSAASLIDDYCTLAERIRERGIRAMIATLVPREGGYGWGEKHELERSIVNEWIRGQSVFDAVLDFDRALKDPATPGRIRSEFDADGTHPNSDGYRAMADSIDLGIFAHDQGLPS